MNKTIFELREWQSSDKYSLAENANNIHIWNNLRNYFPHPYTVKDGKTFIQRVKNKPKPATNLAIVVDEKAVGGVGIVLRTDVERITAELGYWLGENYWNKGIMTEAVKQDVEHTIEIIEAGEVVDVFSPIRQDYL
jgi:RimJ/RimL family protein N-acetyltransferase